MTEPDGREPRLCAKCGVRPVGSGRVLCPGCKTAIEERNRALIERNREALLGGGQ